MIERLDNHFEDEINYYNELRESLEELSTDHETWKDQLMQRFSKVR